MPGDKNRIKKPTTLTKKELIEILEDVPDDTLVMFAINAPDYWKTQRALPIETAEEVYVEHDGYHNGFKETDPDDEADPHTNPKYTPVLILR